MKKEIHLPAKAYKSLVIEDIKEVIRGWRFVVCPTEEKDPFFWRWNEDGLKMLAIYIHKILEEARTNAIRECIDEVEKLEEKIKE